MFSVPIRLRTASAASALGLFIACSGGVSSEDPPALKLKAENGGPKLPSEDWSQVPVPPADGPKLAPVAMAVPIRAKPARDAEVVGVLRVGARVARSAAP